MPRWSSNRTRAQNRALQAELARRANLVGDSPPMQQVRTLIARVGPTEARVLITGESGTGKELVAAAVHAASRRVNRAFVTVNCAAIPRDLVESEMFGHERGAFTGATERRLGRFELAHEGTLFLDEIGDLSPEAQAKLLRTLETGELQRIGAETSLHIDVRIVAATNRRLEDEVADGGFREDLFFRLNVFPIHLPPLRERLEDLPALVTHLAERVRPRQAATFTPAALDAMRELAWPGNVRELANLVERLSILCGPTVDAGAVRGVLRGGSAAAGPRRPDAGRPLSEALDEFERGLISAALAQAEGNMAEAASVLQTDRANLYRRMRRLGIEKAAEADRASRPFGALMRWPRRPCSSCWRFPPWRGPRTASSSSTPTRRPRLARAGGPASGGGGGAIAFYNDSATTRMEGDITLPEGSRFVGRLAVYRGTLRIGGRVDGPIAVANGTLYLLPGAEVRGDILVVGGRLIRSPGDASLGTRAGVLGRRAGDAERGRTAGDPGATAAASATWRRPAPASRPARSGPRCCSPPGAPTTGSRGFRSSSVPRSTSGPASARRSSSTCAASCAPPAVTRGWHDFGYEAKGEFRYDRFGISGQVYSQLGAIEDHPLSLERDRLVRVSPAAGLPRLLRSPRLRRDRSGRRPPGRSAWRYRAGGTTERSVRATDPWSLFRNSVPGGRNPPIDDGHYITTGAQVDFDTRNERYLPSTGWLLRARFEHSSTGRRDTGGSARAGAAPGPPRAAVTTSTACSSTSAGTLASRPTCG